MSSMTPEVEAVGKMHFEGMMIPHNWYHSLTRKTKRGAVKPYMEAILVLSAIVYRGQQSPGLFQCTYQSLSDLLGISKQQVKRAIYYLRDHRLIEVEQRTIETEWGILASNVTFVLPLPENVEKLSLPTPCGPSRAGYVYLIQSGNLYKIGLSVDVEARSLVIEKEVGEPVRILHHVFCNDVFREEQRWHKHLRDYNHHGEWFRLSAEQVAEFMAWEGDENEQALNG